jgi:cullin 1
MLLDMEVLRDLDHRFEEWRGAQDLPNYEFTVSFKALSTANWPLKPPDAAFVIPGIVRRAHNEFTDFYNEEHPGRKLLWLWQLCHGEIRMRSECSPAKGYILHASAYQIAILLLFNDKVVIEYEEIQQSTGLTDEILGPLMTVFLKKKVLRCEERDNIKFYSVNETFSSKKVRNNIRVSLKKQKNAELDETHQKIKEERKFLMQVSTFHVPCTRMPFSNTMKQAAIVRIMKSRKTMEYQQLALETSRQLQSRFAIKDTDLRKCVDLLVDREFLEWREDGSLAYLA